MVYRFDGVEKFVYVADGNDWFNLGAPVLLHERIPATYMAALTAWKSEEPGETRLFESGDSKFYQVNLPLRYDGKVVAMLMLNDDATMVADEISSRQNFILFGVALVIFIEMFVSWLLTTFRVRPLLILADAASQIAAGNLDVEIPRRSGQNEIALLVSSFGAMTRQLREQRDQRRGYIESLERRLQSYQDQPGAGDGVHGTG